MNYFAFGSNMSVKRLRERVPSAIARGAYRLLRHDLRFHKQGMDGSAKCDAFYTGSEWDVIHGVLYTINSEEKPVLDQAEGLGLGYELKEVSVVSGQGRAVSAFLYYATHIDESLQPFSWYKQHVLVGAREAQLPMEYRARIESIEAIHDADRRRDRLQRALYL